MTHRLRKEDYSSDIFLSQSANQFVSFLMQFGSGFYDGEATVGNKKMANRTVYKRA